MWFVKLLSVLLFCVLLVVLFCFRACSGVVDFGFGLCATLFGVWIWLLCYLGALACVFMWFCASVLCI